MNNFYSYLPNNALWSLKERIQYVISNAFSSYALTKNQKDIYYIKHFLAKEMQHLFYTWEIPEHFWKDMYVDADPANVNTNYCTTLNLTIHSSNKEADEYLKQLVTSVSL